MGVQSIVIERALFQVLPSAADTGFGGRRIVVQLPTAEVRYSIECFARVIPGTDPGTYPFPIWTLTPGQSPVQWIVYPAAEPGGTLYPSIRPAAGTVPLGVYQDCPDAWEDDGTIASTLVVDVISWGSSSGRAWLQNDAAPSGVPSLTIVFRLTVEPGPGKCFTDREWSDIEANTRADFTDGAHNVPAYKAI